MPAAATNRPRRSKKRTAARRAAGGVDAETRRWMRGPMDEAAVAAGCRFDLAAAEHVRTFFSKFLRHSKGGWAGQPFMLLDWQWRDVVAPLFGWRRPDGTRRYRRAYIEIPKKNGKTTLVAGLALYGLVGDEEAGAEVYLAAADRDQASIMFAEGASMVRQSPDLSSRLLVTDSRKQMGYVEGNATLKALSADAYKNEGLNASMTLIDELHAQRDDRLWRALRYAGASRRQPLLVAITTAGWDRNSVCWQQHVYAQQVAEGVFPDAWDFLPVIYAAGPEDDWKSPAVWRTANPSLGVTIREEDFEADCREAARSTLIENDFRRYRLNQWTEQAVRWLPMDAWDACAAPVDAKALEGRPCFAGVDLASTTDLAACVLVFPPAAEDEPWRLLPYFWAPRDNARERELRDHVPYVAWAREGRIELTEGNVIDYKAIRARVNDLGRRYAIRQVAIDPWNAQQFTQQLADEDGFEVIEFRQGFISMNAPSKELERLIRSGRLAHGGHPILRWNASNVAAQTDPAGNVKPDKQRSSEKIDGIVAAIMALGLAMVAPQSRSVYDTRGLVSVNL